MGLSPFSRIEPIPRVSVRYVHPELFAAQRPLIITGALEGSLACHRWTPAYLKELAGERLVPVEYSARPIYRPHPKLNGGRYFRKEMKLSRCIELVTAPHERGVWHYLSALSLKDYLPEALAQLEVPPLLPVSRFHSASLYIGSSRTGSQLHYDITDNLLAVFCGQKRVTLLRPSESSKLYPLSPHCFACNTSQVNIEQRDPGRFPRFKNLHGLMAEVRKGEILYIPRYWWHHAVNEGVTIGVTFSWKTPSWELARWRRLRVYLPYLLERVKG